MTDKPTSESSTSRPAARNNTVDAVVAVILFVVGLVVVIEARRLGAGWSSDGPGAGYFPFYIGLIICVSSLGVLYQSVISKNKDTGSFVNRDQLRLVLSVLLPAAVYVLAIYILGIYVASALYVALFMIILGKYSPVRSMLLAIGVNVVFFMMFEVWFKVPLYKGVLEPLGFLGY